MKIKTNYITQENSNHLIQYIRDFINNNEEVIIVNIGTDLILADSLFPIVGTILEENNCPIKVYGTINNPIHALNLNDKLEEIKILHPNAKIIGGDACLGAEADIGEIQCRDYAIEPGKGVGKTLPKVGDISIIGISGKEDTFEFLTNKNVRLSLIYGMAKVISDIILTVCDSSSKNIKLYNRNKNTYEINDIDSNEEVAAN